MGRIADAIQTLFKPSWDTRIARYESEVRTLTAELNDSLEKLNMAMARMAKRDSRAAKRAIEQIDNEDEQLPLPQPASTKAQLRAQAFPHLIKTRKIP